jgi:2-(1,2-epoxy-1,2-dihydrophenyl)acetyl-CoA isomerase
MSEELIAAATEAQQDDEVRVIVLTGAGADFCDGDPRTEPAGLSDEMAPVQLKHLWQMLEHSPLDVIQHLDKPTIAAINGRATGVGFDLAVCCDMRLASQTASLASMHLQHGLTAGVTTYLLPRIVGLGKAAELLYTGKVIDGNEAERIGLVDRAVAADGLEAATAELAGRIAKGPPVAMRFTKRALYRGLGAAPDAAKEYTTVVRTLGMRITEETREGFSSFVEKREPRF